MENIFTAEEISAVLAEEDFENFRATSKTLLRRFTAAELNTLVLTMVWKDNKLVEESRTVVKEDSFLARRANPGINVPNEWPIGLETVKKNYGEETIAQITEEFQGFQKKVVTRAARLTKKHFDALGLMPTDTLKLKVSFSDLPMNLHMGAYFVKNGGYGISQQDMNHYEKI